MAQKKFEPEPVQVAVKDGLVKQKLAFLSMTSVKTWQALAVIAAFAGVSAMFMIVPGLGANSQGPSEHASETAQIATTNPEVLAVQQAIKEKGRKWIAGDTDITKLTPEERKLRFGWKIDEMQSFSAAVPVSSEPTAAELAVLPATFDWRNNSGNYVSAVKNQGGCGSCWAFASTAALESATMIYNKTPNNTDLSEQVLMSCSGGGTCAVGGYISIAANFIRDTGLPSETYYPYTATDGNCANAQTGWLNNTKRISSWLQIKADVASIKSALTTYGPLVATMMCYYDFDTYRGGIYQYTTGAQTGGHVVLIVGYDDNNQYFIAKNSWGTGWGETGFFRIGYSELASVTHFAQYTYAYVGGTTTPIVMPTITLNSFNSGETVEQGMTVPISWTSTGSIDAVIVELLSGDTVVQTIALDTSRKWTIPATVVPGNNYKIRVRSAAFSNVSDISDMPFTILAQQPQTITVTSPNGGEIWRRSGNKTISWNYTGNIGDYIDISLLNNGVLAKQFNTVNAGTYRTGSYTFKMSNTIPIGSNYTVSIASHKFPTVFDASDSKFSITK